MSDGKNQIEKTVQPEPVPYARPIDGFDALNMRNSELATLAYAFNNGYIRDEELRGMMSYFRTLQSTERVHSIHALTSMYMADKRAEIARTEADAAMTIKRLDADQKVEIARIEANVNAELQRLSVIPEIIRGLAQVLSTTNIVNGVKAEVHTKATGTVSIKIEKW